MTKEEREKWGADELFTARLEMTQEMEGADPDETFCIAWEGSCIVARYLPGSDGEGVYLWDIGSRTWSWVDDVAPAPSPGSSLLRWWDAARRLGRGRGLRLPLEPTVDARQAHEADSSAYWYVRQLEGSS